jgi:hypothetical protein
MRGPRHGGPLRDTTSRINTKRLLYLMPAAERARRHEWPSRAPGLPGAAAHGRSSITTTLRHPVLARGDVGVRGHGLGLAMK